uniref:Ig-like domain-containing protein n=1 Tax=Sphenodon punctatus TaxID=8508 RepID=A0A8D0LCF8_SPHPU
MMDLIHLHCLAGQTVFLPFPLSHLLLCLSFEWVSEAQGDLEMKAGAVGSSVLLPAPDNITNMSFMQWEYRNASMSEYILQYYVQSSSTTVYPSYHDRVDFYPANGSLLLKKLREIDSGVYKATVNLIESGAKETFLEIFKPVSQPQLWSNSNLAGTTVALFCEVSEGRVDKIDWEKEGEPLPLERCYLLSENRSVLYIRRAEKPECGSFSCNVSNKVSWKESSLDLTLTSVSPLSGHALRMAAVALTFALVSGLGFIILLCQSEKRRLEVEAWRWVIVFIQGLVCVSAFLLFGATVLWMQEQGASAALILLDIFLTSVIIVTILVSATLALRPAKLSEFKTKKWQCIFLDFAAPGGVVVIVLFASYLMQNILDLSGEMKPHSDCIVSLLAK